MSITSLFVGSGLFALAYLVFYDSGFLYLSLSMLFGRRAPAKGQPSRQDRGDVTILVPSHHEGAAVVDTVRTLLNQDYKGKIAVWLIVEDRSDNSIAALEKAFSATVADGPTTVIHDGKNRTLVVFQAGVRHKRDKINFALPQATSAFIAFLDADHRAAPDWISSALAVMKDEGTAGVQSRRRPLAANRLPQLWDCAENHIGNEAFNTVMSRNGCTVFFTGTTAVFERRALAGRLFPDCVTEDTALSLDLLLAGARIAYDGGSGSYEEVAPSLKSFVARRRRWSAGHNRAVFDRLPALWRAKMPRRQKLQLFFYSQFYWLAGAVLVLLNAEAAFSLIQFPAMLRWPVVAGVFATSLLLLQMVGAEKHRLTTFIIGCLWVLPQITWGLIFAFRWSGAEAYYALIAFPYQDELLVAHIATVFLPLLVIFIAWPRLGVLNPIQMAMVFLTAPALLFFDLYACLLGIADFLLGRSLWSRIERSGRVAAELVPEALRAQLSASVITRTRWLRWLWVPALALFVVLLNDAFAFDNCGAAEGWLWKPLLLKGGGDIRWSLTLDKRAAGSDALSVIVTSRIASSHSGKTTLGYRFDDESPVQSGEEHYTRTFPLGFSAHTLSVTLKGRDFECHRQRRFSTTLSEVRDQQLLVNGEPFLIKGVIPSFSAEPLALPIERGYAQIKAIGANLVRLYHAPQPEALAAAEKEQLFILDQPDESTWRNINLSSAGDRRKLAKSYRKLVEKTEGFPYILMDSVGNELEIGKNDYADNAANIADVVHHIDESGRRVPLAYSTYVTFMKYPVDIIGINMLDTGRTYWESGLGLLRGLGKPFFASEFGGFVALYETVPTALRVARLRRYWKALLDAGALGACLYESNDNWAQSVPPGVYNDPLRPDQPDDLRGLWDRDNHPKPELRFVEGMFSDVDVTVSPRAWSSAEGEVPVVFTNRRAYRLGDVNLSYQSETRALGDLAPGQAATVDIARERLAGILEATLSYETHHGLAGRSVVHLAGAQRTPVILNDDFVASDAERHHGELVDSAELVIAVPPQQADVSVNGTPHQKDVAGLVRLAMPSAFVAVEDLEQSRDGGPFSPFAPEAIGGGRYGVRFRATAKTGHRYLILSGLGTEDAIVHLAGRDLPFKVHSYRDNVIDMTPWEETLRNDPTIVVEVQRDKILYVDPKQAPWQNPVKVELEPPVIFSPVSVTIE